MYYTHVFAIPVVVSLHPGGERRRPKNASAFAGHHWVIQPGFVKFLRIYGLVYHSEGNNPPGSGCTCFANPPLPHFDE